LCERWLLRSVGVVRRVMVILMGLVLLVLPQLLPLPGLSAAGGVTLGIFLMAALYWVREPIPIYATSLLVILGQCLLLSKDAPLVLMFGYPYGAGEAPGASGFTGTLANPTIILFLGGFMLAAGAVRFATEKNLVRVLLGPFGTRPSRVLLGVMLTTALLSAFMSNTATTAMMIAMVVPLMAVLKAGDPLRVALALAIPLGANLGGIATPIGTPANAIAVAALAEAGMPVTFALWMAFGFPLVMVALGLGWLVLMWLFPAEAESVPLEMEGRFDRSPKAVAFYLIAGVTIVGWATESMHGIPSGTVAFLPIALLPCFGILGQREIRGLSWEVLWLVAGGLSLGNSLRDTGLAEWVIAGIPWEALPLLLVYFLFLLLGVLMSTFLSNTVTSAILVPVALSLGVVEGMTGAGVAALAVAVAVSTSFGMSLPISTPPNAIAISTGVVKTPEMIRLGVVMGLLGIPLILFAAFFLWPMMLQ